jgi:class 3 adenylate cyclase
MTFLLAEALKPSNEGAGYVLRRIMRRAVRHGRLLGITTPFLRETAAVVIDLMGEAHPALVEHRDTILDGIAAEEEKCARTPEAGSARLAGLVAAGGTISGAAAFRLHDTFGFPIDLTIEMAAERDVTVWVSDSSGFTRKTHEHGILQFLAVMTRCYGFITPVLRRHGGKVHSERADNILAVFPDSGKALRAAVAVQRRLRSHNRGKRDAEQFHLCIGIHSGRALELSDDVYGDCVNVASKMGEDLAGKGEILVSGEVSRRVKGRFRCTYTRSAELGGRTFELYRVGY